MKVPVPATCYRHGNSALSARRQLSHQLGSDRVAQLATQAGAVGVEMVEGPVPWSVVRRGLSVLSWSFRLANFAVSPASASRSSGVLIVLATMLASFGLAIVTAGAVFTPIAYAAGVVWGAVLLGEILVKQWRLAIGTLILLGIGLGTIAAGRHWRHVLLELLGTFVVSLAALLAGFTGRSRMPVSGSMSEPTHTTTKVLRWFTRP